MQEKMKEIQENLKKIEVEGSGGGNLSKSCFKRDYEMKSIFIKPECKKRKRRNFK